MSREDIDTIIGIMGVVVGGVGAIPIFKGYYFGLLTSSNARNLKKLKNERELFVNWKSSTSYFVVYLLSGVIILFALLGISLLFHGMPRNARGLSFDPIVDFISGFAIYMVAVGRLGKISRLNKFDKTIKFLDARIERLEAKVLKNQTKAATDK